MKTWDTGLSKGERPSQESAGHKKEKTRVGEWWSGGPELVQGYKGPGPKVTKKDKFPIIDWGSRGWTKKSKISSPTTREY